MIMRKDDPDYADWSFYGSCQACQAIGVAAKLANGKKAAEEE